jgi:hypothetical protein
MSYKSLLRHQDCCFHVSERCYSLFIIQLVRVKLGKNESTGVEEKSSNNGLVCEGSSETEVRRREGAVRGRGEMLCLIDDGYRRHDSEEAELGGHGGEY